MAELRPDESNKPGEGIFTTRTTISDAPSWVFSLLKQVRDLREDRLHPRARFETTAARDPGALDKLIETPSPVASLIAQIREIVQNTLHPRKIEITAAPVEVEEIWSKHKTAAPRMLAVVFHVALLTLALIPWASAKKPPKATETAVMLYLPADLILPPKAADSGGGGGGGKRQLTLPSKGRLPRPAEKQLAPPDPEPPKNPDPTLIVEPTVVAPQLAQLPQLNLLNIGDPNGIPGPPSSGPGTGGGIGTGQGRGVGEGKGPGVGPGEGGGFGGGVFRIGGGVSPPTVIHRTEPQYSEEARKARYQGAVVIHRD